MTAQFTTIDHLQVIDAASFGHRDGDLQARVRINTPRMWRQGTLWQRVARADAKYTGPASVVTARAYGVALIGSQYRATQAVDAPAAMAGAQWTSGVIRAGQYLDPDGRVYEVAPINNPRFDHLTN